MFINNVIFFLLPQVSQQHCYHKVDFCTVRSLSGKGKGPCATGSKTPLSSTPSWSPVGSIWPHSLLIGDKLYMCHVALAGDVPIISCYVIKHSLSRCLFLTVTLRPLDDKRYYKTWRNRKKNPRPEKIEESRLSLAGFRPSPTVAPPSAPFSKLLTRLTGIMFSEMTKTGIQVAADWFPARAFDSYPLSAAVATAL